MISSGTALAARSYIMAPSFEDEDTAELLPLPSSPTWLMPPPERPGRSRRARASSALAAFFSRASALPTSKVEIRYVDVVFGLAASAAIGALSVLALLELAN